MLFRCCAPVEAIEEEVLHWTQSKFFHQRGCLHGLEGHDDKFPAHTERVPHWSYEPRRRTGPSHWGTLCGAYSAAASGSSQSPINIIDHDTIVADTELHSLQFKYEAVPATLSNTGHSMQVSLEGGHLLIEGETFNLKQFHFHFPSEHTINGMQFPMEMHMVHTNGTGNIAVIALLFQHGLASPFLEQFWNMMPTELGSEVNVTQVDVRKAISEGSHYFRYIGSLTTPPCTEGVVWTVMRQVHDMSVEQAQWFQERTGFAYPNPGNNRPVQPLNSRVVKTFK